MIDEHRGYLRDRHRLAAYERALQSIVPAGAVVADIASGTGILGLLACRAGAGRVYAIEKDGIAGLAREIARANAAGGRIVQLRGDAGRVTLPEPAAVAVCDQMGPFGIDAGVIELAGHARARFLAPDGTFVPQQLEVWLAAIEHDRIYQRLGFWQTRPAQFDFSPVAGVAFNTPAHIDLDPIDLLSAPAAAAAIDLMRDVPLPIVMTASLKAARRGTLHGVGGWFTAWLAPGVSMTNSPIAADRILRRQIFLPSPAPVDVEEGQAIDVKVQARPAEAIYAWEIRADGRETMRGSSLQAVMLDRADLERTRPEHRPRLSGEGSATLLALSLCDGRRTIAEIERAVFEAHGDLFQTPASAAAFVADVIARA